MVEFGAGCFWGVEDLMSKVPGVLDTTVGYEGGTTENPTYEDVCSHTTGHTEVCQVIYDPAVISFDQLMKEFWKIHDPTTLNRQGPDIGVQYRSVVFYHTPEQKAVAEASKDALAKSGTYSSPIVTAIEPAQIFWRAEEYHQKYFIKHPGASCSVASSE